MFKEPSTSMLDGVEVLDLTRLLPGPYCTWILSELGARVLKVEDPWEGDYARGMPFFDLINRGKGSITLNLKEKAGKEIFSELVAKSDVLVEGFRPGTMEKLGLGYETLREHNERIIYCSISGYGQSGPYRSVPGHDINYISVSGLLGINLSEGVPVVPGMLIADIAGGLFGALSIIASLYRRGAHGGGGYIDVSMTDVVHSFFSIMQLGQIRQSLLSLPGYNIYRTKDGKFVSVGTLETKFWRNFCLKMGREDLIERQFDPFATEELREKFLERTRDDWIELFRGGEAMVTPVYSPEEVFDDPQIAHRKVFDRERGILNFPVKFSNWEANEEKKPPERGESTSEVLRGLGYDEPGSRG
jgi:crotonobetainyl-CoA:carnitine CoA-transferase CaiB-like acyl-CoA transferase